MMPHHRRRRASIENMSAAAGRKHLICETGRQPSGGPCVGEALADGCYNPAIGRLGHQKRLDSLDQLGLAALP